MNAASINGARVPAPEADVRSVALDVRTAEGREILGRLLETAQAAGVVLGWPVEASGTLASQTDPTRKSRRQR